jgi:hypothetical protein
MALAPKAQPPLSGSDEDRLVALEARHATTVGELERCLDASLRGRRVAHGASVTLSLPLGAPDPARAGERNDARLAHDEHVLADLCARYHASGWASATVDAAAGTITLVP